MSGVVLNGAAGDGKQNKASYITRSAAVTRSFFSLACRALHNTRDLLTTEDLFKLLFALFFQVALFVKCTFAGLTVLA